MWTHREMWAMYRDHMKTHPEEAMCKKRQASEACSTDSLPLDFQTSELWQNKSVTYAVESWCLLPQPSNQINWPFSPICVLSNWSSNAFAHLAINPKTKPTSHIMDGFCWDHLCWLFLDPAQPSSSVIGEAISGGWSSLSSLLILHLQLYPPLLLLDVVGGSWANC